MDHQYDRRICPECKCPAGTHFMTCSALPPMLALSNVALLRRIQKLEKQMRRLNVEADSVHD